MDKQTHSVTIDGVEYMPVPDTNDRYISIKGVTYVKYPGVIDIPESVDEAKGFTLINK
jgi:hypothetical protein